MDHISLSLEVSILLFFSLIFFLDFLIVIFLFVVVKSFDINVTGLL